MRIPWLSNRTRRTPNLRRARPCRFGGRASAFGTSPSWASTSLCSRFPSLVNRFPVTAQRAALFRLHHRRGFAFLLNLGSLLGDIFALIDPALHANHPISRVGFRGPEINVRAQRLQRQPSLQVPFLARDFRTVQPACHAHLDAFAAEAQRRIHCFTHRAPKGHALFQLQRDRFRHQSGIQLRTMDFLDVNVHFAFGALLHVLLQLVDFRAFAPDNDARPRGVNAHHQLVRRAFDVDRADARTLQLLLQLFAELDVFVKKIGILLVGIPPRLKRLVVTQPESIRVRLLSHSRSPYFLLLALFRWRLLAGQSLANTARRAAHALLRFGFRHVGCHAFRGRHVMLSHSYPQVRGALLVAERPPHRRGAQPLPARPFIHETLRHEQLVHVERRAGVIRLAFRIGNRAAQHFFNVLGGALGGVLQRLQSVLRLLPPDEVHHQSRLLRRHSYMPRQRVRFNQCVLCLHVSHDLRLRRRGCCCRWCCAASRWCRTRGLLERRFHSVAFERTCRGELAQLVPDHLLRHIHGNEFLPVVHRDSVPDHFWHDRRTPRPRLDHFLFVARVESFDFYAQVAVHKRPFFQ